MKTDKVRSDRSDDHYDDDNTDDYYDDDIAVEDDVYDADHRRSAAVVQKLTTSVFENWQSWMDGDCCDDKDHDAGSIVVKIM